MSMKINKATYSNEDICEDELEYVKTNVENIIKIKYNNLSLKQKILFKYIYNL